ncbi:MAG: hypothetical protein ACRDS9_04205 [Pseudonocardiaceae bacterium]
MSSDFTVVQEAAITLPTAAGGTSNLYPAFSADTVTPTERSVLSFLVNPSGTSTMQIKLNNVIVLNHIFNTEPMRTFHEIVQEGVLNPANNLLEISLTAGTGSVTVSDVFMTFR